MLIFLLIFIAYLAKRAFGAFRSACRAYVSTKINKPVAEVALLLRLAKLGEDKLYAIGVLECLGIKAEATANADTMRICNDCGPFIYVAEQKICNLSSDTRKAEKLVHRVG